MPQLQRWCRTNEGLANGAIAVLNLIYSKSLTKMNEKIRIRLKSYDHNSLIENGNVQILETFDAEETRLDGRLRSLESLGSLKTDIAENTSSHASIDGIRSIPTLMLGDTSGEFPVFFDTSFEQQ